MRGVNVTVCRALLGDPASAECSSAKPLASWLNSASAVMWMFWKSEMAAVLVQTALDVGDAGGLVEEQLQVVRVCGLIVAVALESNEVPRIWNRRRRGRIARSVCGQGRRRQKRRRKQCFFHYHIKLPGLDIVNNNDECVGW